MFSYIFICRYGKIELSASSPIVPFRETIISPPKVDMVNEVILDQPIRSVKTKEFEDDEEVIEMGVIETFTTNRKCCIRIRALPLPDTVTDILEENQHLLKTLHKCSRAITYGDTSDAKDIKITVLEAMKDLKASLSQAFTDAGKSWTDVTDNIWAFGPKRVGPNMLVNRVEDYHRPSVWDIHNTEALLRDFDSNIVGGFQMATFAGPLCEEPMRGVCFVIEKWTYDDASYARLARMSESENIVKLTEDDCSPDTLSTSLEKDVIIEEVEDQSDDNEEEEEDSSCDEAKEADDVDKVRRRREYGPFSGQIISCVMTGCRKAFHTRPQRLMMAMYKCNIQATTDVLGQYLL